MNQASGPKPTGSKESGLHFMKNRKSRGVAPGPGRAAESSAEKLRGCQHRRTRFARDGAELPPATFSGADSDRRRSRAKRLGCADASPAATHRNSPHTTTVCSANLSNHNACRTLVPSRLNLLWDCRIHSGSRHLCLDLDRKNIVDDTYWFHSRFIAHDCRRQGKHYESCSRNPHLSCLCGMEIQFQIKFELKLSTNRKIIYCGELLHPPTSPFSCIFRPIFHHSSPEAHG